MMLKTPGIIFPPPKVLVELGIIVIEQLEVSGQSRRGLEVIRVDERMRRGDLGVICPTQDHRDHVQAGVKREKPLRDVILAESIFKGQIKLVLFLRHF